MHEICDKIKEYIVQLPSRTCRKNVDFIRFKLQLSLYTILIHLLRKKLIRIQMNNLNR